MLAILVLTKHGKNMDAHKYYYRKIKRCPEKQFYHRSWSCIIVLTNMEFYY